MKGLMFYKYVGVETALRIITSGKLMYTTPDKFNDPYDTYASTPKPGFHKMIKRIQHEQDPYAEVTAKRNFREREELYKKIDREEIRRNAVKNFAITCFSKSPYILPMWAHYADNHAGCVLGFKIDNKIEEEIKKMALQGKTSVSGNLLFPLDVIYDDVRPPIYNKDGLTSHDETPKIFLTKAKAWSYEEEVRCFKLGSSGVYDFKRTQLKQVYFGLKMKHEDRTSIKKALDINKKHFQVEVKTCDVIMHLSNYELQKR
ncbi:TPA: DUF2971 domain-containing protein [Yersinia enterocolitica]|uniref:DUF2971 domain-containing protein n=1 Tax=Yersinia enterocolitica TaxID=630 RepID=UPI00067B643C|nr:DUF2971 domain-containing protein [Yersinia enterocolitica]EKN4828932.1 DUF2971 domain-containing protein [Yersinia enterocolitica]EKN4850407.1 DUF2971 domain-containing protein [Yersinia enterocolitica]ELI8304745.1 DUF2971 domain-containing protein [Yersinia enterocolitica]ELW8174859.1 DUF2971 domain-containing protein [Yersinia enterocolitica]UYJ78307.1 DUF2971 domain-containing protein [Yersinia enterocolitica]